MTSPEPQKEHLWLQQLVGEWASEGEASMGPDKPPEIFKTTESVRTLGGLWVVCEGTMPDGVPARTIMTLGYDPVRKRFRGTFIGSMMTHLWLYDGELDATGRILTLDSEGPSFTAEGQTSPYRDIIEIKSADHRVLSSQVPDEKGGWNTFMTAHYRRVK